MSDEDILKKRITGVMSLLNEKQRRQYLAYEAESLGRGGISKVSQLSGANRNTIAAGLREIHSGNPEADREIQQEDSGRIRKKGAGRKPITESQPGIEEALLKLVENDSYGNPETPLLWTSKSTRHLAQEPTEQGYQIGPTSVRELLAVNGYSLQQNQKNKQVGEPSPDRDAQFRHINETCLAYMTNDEPVISIDCKKKENIGNFKNNGAEYAPKSSPTQVLDHDFPLPEKGKAIPYGVYDLSQNEGFVNVGITSDTAEFAVASIRMWWEEMGKTRYPNATKLYITADGGGSNGSRNRLFKVELQKLVNEIGIPIEVSHFPPGTSKWNKIEHRMFSQISKNWRGRPLETLAIIINLIANTTTEKGLVIKCGLDSGTYKTGIKVTDEELGQVNIIRNTFRGDWNYVIAPANYCR